MKIVTWNINSVRLRLDLIQRLVDEKAPDVLCLQETKVMNELFPKAALAEMGFKHQQFNGMKSYNGVAILSRHPLTDGGAKNWQNKEDCRHVFATLPNGTEVHCCYIPAGGDIPDVGENPKFAHKLGFLDEMTEWWKKRKKDGKSKIFLGDFNIAPLETDVFSHKQMIDVVSHTPIEVEKLGILQKSHDWHDTVRHFIPPEEKLFSWWSYRAFDWEKSNRGLRLDHIWVTPDLIPSLKGMEVMKEARGWQPKPSDHVPVILTL
jgi:exodeoxyribonuclease-3